MWYTNRSPQGRTFRGVSAALSQPNKLFFFVQDFVILLLGGCQANANVGSCSSGFRCSCGVGTAHPVIIWSSPPSSSLIKCIIYMKHTHVLLPFPVIESCVATKPGERRALCVLARVFHCECERVASYREQQNRCFYLSLDISYACIKEVSRLCRSGLTRRRGTGTHTAAERPHTRRQPPLSLLIHQLDRDSFPL